SLNDFRQALETYREAREHCVKHDMPLLVAEADYNIAYLYYLRGEYTQAIELYRITREHCHELGDLYHQGLCDLDQSEMFLELNLSEEGGHLAQRALDTFKQLGMGYEAAKAVSNLAIATSHHGDSAGALELFRQARDLFGKEQNLAWIAIIDLYQALVLYQDGKLQQAQLLSENAYRFFAQSPLVGKAALCQLLLARIHLNSGRIEPARKVCLEALGRVEQAETPAIAYQAYFVLGLIEEAAGRPDAAFQAYQEAHGRLERMRSHLRAEEMKIAFLKDKLAIYEALVRLSLSRGCTQADQETAFGYIEQAKSRSLADLIAFRGSSLPNPRETHRVLIEHVSSLREELNWYSRAIQLLESGAATLRAMHLERLRRAARDCEHRLLDAMANLRVEDKEYANVEDARPIELDAIRASLPEDAMLLQYYRVQD